MRPETMEFHNDLPVRAFVRAGNQYPYHWHDALEIVRVLKGSVNIGMGDDEVPLREGDIAITNMGEIHRMTGDADNEILFVHIDAGFCHSVLPDRYLFLFCCSPYHGDLEPEKYGILKNYIARLVALLAEGPQAADRNAVGKLLTEMLVYTGYNFDLLRWGFGTEAFDEKRVARLRQMAKYTTSDTEVQMGLTALAAELGVSLQHLSADIKEKFGMTFQELLCYGRCERAARLLLGTNMRIVEIALHCGFSDVKYLIKYFRRFFHATPSGFQKLYRADSAALARQTQYSDMPLGHAVRLLSAEADGDHME